MACCAETESGIVRLTSKFARQCILHRTMRGGAPPTILTLVLGV